MSGVGSDPFDGLDESEREIMAREMQVSGIRPAQRRSDYSEPEGLKPLTVGPDLRDMRDPGELGAKLLSDRAFRAEACQHLADGDPAMSQVYDYGAHRGLL